MRSENGQENVTSMVADQGTAIVPQTADESYAEATRQLDTAADWRKVDP